MFDISFSYILSPDEKSSVKENDASCLQPSFKVKELMTEEFL